MPPLFVTSIFDRFREKIAEQRDAQEVRTQSAAFRRWASLGDMPVPGMTPGDLFPLGRQYERQRLEDTNLRPPAYTQRQQEPPSPMLVSAIEGLGQDKRLSLSELNALPVHEREAYHQFQLQRDEQIAQASVAARPPPAPPPVRQPQPTQEQIDLQEIARVQAQFQEDVDRGVMTPEQATSSLQAIVQDIQGNIIPSGQGPLGIPLGPLGAPQPGAGTGFLPRWRDLLTPQVNPSVTEPLGNVPVIGSQLEKEAQALTSPLGSAALIGGGVGLARAQGVVGAGLETLAGSVGSVGAGTAGEALDVPAPVQIALEVGGGITPAAALTGPGRVLLRSLVKQGISEDEALKIVAKQVPSDVLAARPASQEGADAVRNMMTSPHREARDQWQLYAGSVKQAERDIRVWGDDTYELFGDAGLDVVRRSDRQPDEIVELMEGMWGDETARGKVGGLRPEAQEAAQSVYDQFDDAGARLKAVDPDFEPKMMPDYMPHLFKVVKPGQAGKRGFQLSPGFKKARELKGGLAEILEARPDLDLVTWDPVDYAKRAVLAVDTHIASLEAVRALKAKGLIVKGAKEGWRTPDIGAFKGGQKLQGWTAEPKVAQVLEQMFGPDAFDQHGALKLAKTTRETLFRAKVFGGAFQLVDYTFRSVLGLGLSEFARLRPGGAVRAWASPLKAVARFAVPGLDRRMTRLANKNPKMRALYKYDLAAGVDPSIGDQAIRGAGSIVPETIAGRQIPGARGLQQTIDFMGGGAYEKFHTEILEQAGLVNLEKNLAKGMSLDDAAKAAVEETNVFFSSVPNWQSAIKSRTGRTALKFPFFATGELEGLFRMPFQAPAGFAGIIGGTVIMAEMLNKMFTGKWLSADQLNPYTVRGDDDTLKGKLPVVGGGGFNPKFLRPELPWKGKDGRPLYLDLLGQADTVFRFALDPQFAVETRLGQALTIPRDVTAVLHGDAPPFGEKVESPADAARFVAQELGPISASALSGTESRRIGTLAAGVQAGGLNVLAAPFADVTAERIASALESGELKGPYDRTPTKRSQLSNTDKVIFDELHPSEFEDREPDDARSFMFDAFKQRDELNEEARNELLADGRAGRFGNMGDQDGRREFWDEASDIQRESVGQFLLIQRQFRKQVEALGDRDVLSPVMRLVEQYFDLQERHSKRRTDEEWAAYEAELQRAFTPEQLVDVKGQLGVGDHDLEVFWDELWGFTEGYHDLPEKGRQRESWRRQHPDGDAALFLLGRVSRTMSPQAGRLVQQGGQNIWGTNIATSRGGRLQPLQPMDLGQLQPLQPLIPR